MNIYHVSYVGDDDNTYSEFFSSKSVALKRNTELKKTRTRERLSLDDDSDCTVKTVHDMAEYNVTMNKQGILDLLNTYFNEKAG